MNYDNEGSPDTYTIHQNDQIPPDGIANTKELAMPPPTEQLAVLQRTECKTTIDDGSLSKKIGVQDLESDVRSALASW